LHSIDSNNTNKAVKDQKKPNQAQQEPQPNHGSLPAHPYVLQLLQLLLSQRGAQPTELSDWVEDDVFDADEGH
jgi:hypothetical protein